MNYRLLCRLLGLLLFLLSIAMLGCMIFSWSLGERDAGMDAFEALGLSTGLTAMGGLVLYHLGRTAGVDILRKEAITVVGMGWMVCGVFGALPYVLAPPHLGVAGAIFESISGFTTTGATVIEDLNPWPRSILMYRCLTQWLGGVGILVLFVALLSYLGVGSKALFQHESSAQAGDGVRSRIRDVAVSMLKVYLTLTFLCMLGLLARNLSPYDAICHAFTAVSTGGFSPHNKSIAEFGDYLVELWLVLFMLLGSISFILQVWVFRGHWQRWSREEETKWFLILVAVSTLVVGWSLMAGEDGLAWPEAFRQALFTCTSIMTTTGYVTADYGTWPPFGILMLLFLMGVGGCAGSTAGSIKVGRWLLFFKIIRLQIVAAYRPNQVFALKLNGQFQDAGPRMQTVFFVALAFVITGAGTAVVSLLEPGLDLQSSFSAVLTSVANVGPGLGAVGPTENFAFLSPLTKLFLSLLMILGRLEFFAVLVLFAPSLWRRY